ncbi:MAG: tRNA (adenosine(37)-N6)-dimethylallyltransferase MiaA [Hydrogenibacillus sp.]|nr:tRNA (adenosine(37)-N6)-dimethylallyltransferase MiaA [Hydrogenibacillus sp.]
MAVVGPTAVGKTALSLTLAERFCGEIVSADSMQVYRGMDIGTAKASPEERARVPHHLIDVVDPVEPYSVARYQAEALRVIADIQARGKVPFLVGGTGLYVNAVVYYPHYRFPAAFVDPIGRRALLTEARKSGREALWQALHARAPDVAARIPPGDVRRVVRAIEKLDGGVRESLPNAPAERRESPFDLLMIGLSMRRDALYRRIEERVDAQIEAGLADEVRRLVERGVPPEATAFQALGYKELLPVVRGEVPLQTAVEALKKRTRQYAKRQFTWFRRLPEIEWYAWDDEARPRSREKIFARVEGYLAQRGECIQREKE